MEFDPEDNKMPFLVVNRFVANEVGPNAAFVYHHISYMTKISELNNKHFHEGRYWFYSSVRNMSTWLTFLTENQIRTALEVLVENSYISRNNFGPYTTLCYTDINKNEVEKAKIGDNEEKLVKIRQNREKQGKSTENPIKPLSTGAEVISTGAETVSTGVDIYRNSKRNKERIKEIYNGNSQKLEDLSNNEKKRISKLNPDLKDELDSKFDLIWTFQKKNLDINKRRDRTKAKKKFSAIAKKDGLDNLVNVIRYYYSSFAKKEDKYKFACGLYNMLTQHYESYKEEMNDPIARKESKNEPRAKKFELIIGYEDSDSYKSLQANWKFAKKSFVNQNLIGSIDEVYRCMSELQSTGEYSFPALVYTFQKYYSGEGKASEDQYTVRPENFFKKKYSDFLPSTNADGTVKTKAQKLDEEQYDFLFKMLDNLVETGYWSSTVCGRRPDQFGHRLSPEHISYYEKKMAEKNRNKKNRL